MGIVKAVSGVPVAKSDHKCENDDLTRDEKLLFQTSPSHESDDCEHAEVDCELAVSGGQMCNVPYGLYDLSELKDILSLETWNFCLTEDDRFRLAAYLPDMDQHDFFTTMLELFSGSAMFFGSPLRAFFYRLNSGFYSPEVSRARELLMSLKRRKYYHFLKLYHDGMIWKFTCMDKLWRRSNTGTSLEEKVPIFADLNSSPFNQSLSIIGGDETASFSLLKRAKLMNGTVTTHCSTKHKERVHREKSMETSSSKIHISQHPNEPSKKCSELPKGVLKRTDCVSITDDNAGIHHTPGLIPLDQLGMQVSILSPYASTHNAHDFAVNSSCSYKIKPSRSTLGISRSGTWQCEGALGNYPILFRSQFGLKHTVVGDLNGGNHSAMTRCYQSAAKHSLAYSHEANDTRESPHEKNFLMNFGRQDAIIPESSDPDARTTDIHQMNEHMEMPNNRNVGNISEMLTLGATTNPSYNNSEQAETMRKCHDGLKIEAPPDIKSIRKVEEHRFPYTYTRRKLPKGHDLGDPIQKPPMAGSESPSVLASMGNVKAKAIKL